MQIWYRRLAALLAVFMLLAALAACANDEQAAGPAEAGEKITQAELDWVWQSMRFKDETVTQAEALTALLEERAVLLEAESLGIAPSLEEARQQAQENYNQFLELYASSDSQNVHGAQEAWQALQDYMQYMGLEKEEYLEEAAKAQQVMMAKSAVIENFVAGLSVYEQADTLIADTGIGISEQHQGTIFKRFYREDAVHDVDGIGIGLYLAREIVTLQGGYIRVASEVGKGSTFSVFLLRK